MTSPLMSLKEHGHCQSRPHFEAIFCALAAVGNNKIVEVWKQIGFCKVGFGGSRRLWRIEEAMKHSKFFFIRIGRNGVELWPCLV